MTPEQEVARKKQLVSAAKALLSLQVGVGIGCVRINKFLHWLSLQDDPRYQIFKQFLAATAGLPLGNERLRWAYAALLECDAKLATIEADFRPRILGACIDIIGTYG
ncbi:DUF2489 domain-containing protein [Dyella sp. C11]|uniref:DUF2489 domain-containing protein n=1 Tax=Dyella sp. C11 TaxID=2126991 RepID=UPI0013009991|nr:DUF2489 domain-containing protein [Dyella sp. C11]